MAGRLTLALANTFSNETQQTYYGLRGGGNYTPRVDYRIVPQSALPNLATWTSMTVGRALETIPNARITDHILLYSTHDITLNSNGDETQSQAIQWDRDILIKR